MRNVVLRPTVSPSLPNASDPNGRTASPMPYVASVLRNANVGRSGGKKCVAIVDARLAKMKKS